MTSKLLWRIAIALFIAFLILNFSMTSHKEFLPAMGWPLFIIDQFGLSIVVVGFAAIVGLLVGLIRFGKKNYQQKIKITIPASISVILLIFTIAVSVIVYQKIVNGVILGPVQ